MIRWVHPRYILMVIAVVFGLCLTIAKAAESGDSGNGNLSYAVVASAFGAILLAVLGWIGVGLQKILKDYGEMLNDHDTRMAVLEDRAGIARKKD